MLFRAGRQDGETQEEEVDEEEVVARTFIINKVFSLLLFIMGLKHFIIFLLLLFLIFLTSWEEKECLPVLTVSSLS